jgi:hypothetical protein
LVICLPCPLLLPLDASTGIDGLRRLCLAVLLPHFLDPLPGHLVEGVMLHWLDQELRLSEAAVFSFPND